MKHAIQLIPAALLAFSMGAQADVAITIQQVGNDVVLRGSGSLMTENRNCSPTNVEITSAPIDSKEATPGLILEAQSPFLSFGQPGSGLVCLFLDASRTGTAIGSSSEPFFGNNAGDNFVLSVNPTDGNQFAAFLPANYASGDELAFSGVIAGKTLQELGLIVGGGYTWTWSTVPIAGRAKAEGTQSLSITVLGAAAPTSATPVPALGTFGLMGLAGAIGAAGVAMNRRRKQ